MAFKPPDKKNETQGHTHKKERNKKEEYLKGKSTKKRRQQHANGNLLSFLLLVLGALSTVGAVVCDAGYYEHFPTVDTPYCKICEAGKKMGFGFYSGLNYYNLTPSSIYSI